MNLGLLLIGLAAALWVVYDAKTKWKYSTGKALMWAAGTLLVVYIVLPLYFFIGRKMWLCLCAYCQFYRCLFMFIQLLKGRFCLLK